MVVNLISLPGVLSPDLVEQFQLAVERMADKPLAQQADDRRALLEKLQDGRRSASADAPSDRAAAASPAASETAGDPESSVTVEGYKMDEMNRSDDTTELTSSGVQWAASLFVLLIIGLFAWGSRLRRR
jgi:cobaltochelatase CobN